MLEWLSKLRWGWDVHWVRIIFIYSWNRISFDYLRRRLSAIILFLNNYSNRLASIISDYLRGRLSSIIFDFFYWSRFICSKTIYLFNPANVFATQHFCEAIYLQNDLFVQPRTIFCNPAFLRSHLCNPAFQNDLFVQPRTIHCEAIYLWRHDLFVQERFICSTQKTSVQPSIFVKPSTLRTIYLFNPERFWSHLCSPAFQHDLYVQPRTIHCEAI